MTTHNFLGIDRSQDYIRVQSGALTVQILTLLLATYMLFTVQAEKALVAVLTIGVVACVVLVAMTSLFLILRGQANGQKSLAVVATALTAIFAAFSLGLFARFNTSVALQYWALGIAVVVGIAAICLSVSKSSKSKVGPGMMGAAFKGKKSAHMVGAGRLAPPTQLTRIDSDASVGLHGGFKSEVQHPWIQ